MSRMTELTFFSSTTVNHISQQLLVKVRVVEHLVDIERLERCHLRDRVNVGFETFADPSLLTGTPDPRTRDSLPARGRLFDEIHSGLRLSRKTTGEGCSAGRQEGGGSN